MAQFRRFLLVTDHDARIAQPACEVDIVSWDSLKSVGNLADYDGWILNTTALRTRAVRKLFTAEELKILCDYRALIAVMEGGGRIFIIGDFKKAFYTPPSRGGTGRKEASPAPDQPFNLFEKILNVERDPRPVDYRRISRPEDYRYKEIYAYLDQVISWNYSLKFPQKSEFDIARVGTTNFGTCLAAHLSFHPGEIFILPSLGTTVEEEDRYILKHFLGIGIQAGPPAWANALAVPEQKVMERALSEKQQSLKELFAEIQTQEKELTNLQRWKRLLYDDGIGLEQIVKESFELLGAKVIKKTTEKDDYQLEVPDRGPCVLEVKSTRKDQFLRRDLRQLSEWIDQATSEQLVNVKGAFVGNGSRENEPGSRGSMFEAKMSSTPN